MQVARTVSTTNIQYFRKGSFITTMTGLTQLTNELDLDQSDTDSYEEMEGIQEQRLRGVAASNKPVKKQYNGLKKKLEDSMCFIDLMIKSQKSVREKKKWLNLFGLMKDGKGLSSSCFIRKYNCLDVTQFLYLFCNFSKYSR
jgi:hypothetical protein